MCFFQGQTRTAPPLPPSKTVSPATPNAPSAHKVIPTRPPPPTNSTVFFQPSQPPPPPPPITKDAPTLSIPLPPPLPILNDVEVETNSKIENDISNVRNNNVQSEDSHSMLMESIRSGTTLKVSYSYYYLLN